MALTLRNALTNTAPADDLENDFSGACLRCGFADPCPAAAPVRLSPSLQGTALQTPGEVGAFGCGHCAEVQPLSCPVAMPVK